MEGRRGNKVALESQPSSPQQTLSQWLCPDSQRKSYNGVPKYMGQFILPRSKPEKCTLSLILGISLQLSLRRRQGEGWKEGGP